ncbi:MULTISPECIES: NUDIX hydrolase [unclassified Ruegeria]|uniref:NUDIX hydrolase n=1 Tax=unclassified Ruegeria TaxID=2625375 RepID=UPI0014885710|nr:MULTISPECIES: NUDIX hydrolase [unclassified Ruegeria]
MTVGKTAIRDAATVIVLRDRMTNPSILMGQRGAKAAFMPNKFVFPGGAVDKEDAEIPLASDMPTLCQDRLAERSEPNLQNALAAAAIRELWEETGLVLGHPEAWPTPAPVAWTGFAELGYRPAAEALQFVFRAVTPPGRPRRFDARFFLVDASAIQGNLDDFSRASDELSHLQWVPLERAREFDLPFITEVVLAEITARVTDTAPPTSVPFLLNREEESLFLKLKGYPMPESD